MTLNVKYSVAIDGQKNLEKLAGVMFDAIADGEQQNFHDAAQAWVSAVVDYMGDKREQWEESYLVKAGNLADKAFDERR